MSNTFLLGVVCGVLVAAASMVLGVLLGGWIRRARLRACTGIAAQWCPVHGDCRCPWHEGGEIRDMNSDECPLHASESSHADYAP